ncbi:MAG: TonB-dependent receptor [Pseudomonadota bacterium]
MLCALSPSAFAQEQDDGFIGLEEITVTAQRRAESIQDIPLAISAFNEDELRIRNIDTALDLTDYIPNLFGGNNTGLGSANAYYIRGLGNTESIATFDPPVGTYIDDIYISRQNANNFSFFDLDRIEVLRGPQGTLFGRNTTGGAINVLLKEPGDEFGGFAEASYGRFDRVTFRASVDLPVTDEISTKFSGFFVDDAGYAYNFRLDERVNDERSFGLRAAVKWTPNDVVNWNVSTTYVNSDVANLANTPVDGDNVFTEIPAAASVNAATLGAFNASGISTDLPRIVGVFTSNEGDVGNSLSQLLAGTNGGNVVRSVLVASNLELDFDEVNIEIITGWLDLEQDFILNFFDGFLSAGPGPSTFSIANDGRHQQFSQEIKATGSLFDGFVDYVAGVYFLNERNETRLAQLFFAPQYDRILDNDTTAGAGYIQLDWNITEQLTLTTGVRYTNETKDIAIEDVAGSPLNCQTANPFADMDPMTADESIARLCSTVDLTAAGIPDELNTSLVTPRFGIQYELNDDVLLFASATRGFKSGAWNARDPLPANLLNIEPEIVWSYEVGTKSQFFDDRLRLNVTGFYSDTTDLQTPSAFENALGQTVFITGNFADLRVFGVEVEATAVVNEYITAIATLGLQDAEYRNLDQSVLDVQAQCNASLAAQNATQLFGGGSGCEQGIVAPDGTIADPVRSPGVTLVLGGNFNYPITDDLCIVSNAFAIFTGSYDTATSGNPEGFQDDFWRFNGNIGVEHVDGDYGVYVECQNCFGENWVQSALAGVQYYNQPGSWTIRGVTRF